jgi:hypothetical protein
MTKVWIGAVLLAAQPLAGAAAESGGAPRIRVGPNVLVSRDGDVAHCETMIAANPRDAKNLIGGSITLTRPDGSAMNKAYFSKDGGATWTDVTFPEELEHGGGDPQVGFGATGTAYFMGLSKGMNFYRSEDGGKTWGEAVNLGAHHDHEMLAVDHTTGPYAGRIYVTDETDVPGSTEMEDLIMRRRVVLFRSSDDGRSFIGPIEIARGNDTGLAAENLLVLSDGALFIPMLEYPNYAKDKDAATWRLVFSLSMDGGVTFSPRRDIGTIRFGGAAAMLKARRSGRVDQMGGPVFAVDARGKKFRDRIYAAWTDYENDRYQLVLISSSDRGRTWTKPRPVVPDDPAGASQFQPMIAVNGDGVLGAFWYGTAAHPKRDGFDVLFAASLDGGASFLPAVKVATAPSKPVGGGNLRPGPFVRADRGMIVAQFLSGFSRWPNGGDYIGLTADADGLFHPFWADARGGTYQLYTAAIRIDGGEASAAAKPTSIGAAPRRVPGNVTDRVTVLFDPVRYDAATGEVFLAARLKNTSKEKLYPPFRVEVKETVHPWEVKAKLDRTGQPQIVNASNGKTGVGAVFDYSDAVRGSDALEPDAVTDAVLWRLKTSSPSATDFHLGLEVTGSVEEKK